MSTTLTIILAGVVLGTIQLVAGVIIGRCLPVGHGRDPGASPETLRDLLRRFSFLVRTVNEDVGQYRAEVDGANQKLVSARADGGSPSVELVLNTVTELLQANQRLHDRLASAERRLQEQAQQIETYVSEARTDPLTGLANRRAFDDELARRLAEWERKGHPFCVLLIDLDYFKGINDRYGHQAGDDVLCQLSQLLVHAVRGMDLVARVGGEEFAVILPSTDSRAARLSAERVRWAVAEHPFQVNGTLLEITVSIGATAVMPDDDAASVMGRADQALYESKRAGRNCGHFHTGDGCEPLVAAPPKLHEQPPPADKPPRFDPELDSLAADLRQRLAELTEP